MVRFKNREHDFSSKLRQDSVIQRLKEYIQWVRGLEDNASPIELPIHSPLSINLDLTSACNYSCPFCVDSGLINAGKHFALEDIQKILDTLSSYGLLSVILIGGGEPTLHPDFEAVVGHIKKRRLQIGIATNGSRLEKIEAIADRLREKDWIRISIDAANEETFKALHHPRTAQTLHQILEKARKVKGKNPSVSLGYSYVIVWEGVDVHGEELCPNIQEVPRAAELAREFSFDYVSFKPCLIRMDDSQRETLLRNVDESKESKIVKDIKVQLQKARDLAGDKVKILESSNLKAMLNQETERIKRQPKRCHMQFYRTVVSPFGIYHCPAFRGVDIAKIAEKDGYLTDKKFKESLKTVAESILGFDAEKECKEVGCFYNETNWWLETFIQSKEKVHGIKKVEDDNFFL
jgi:MoaA/NifB/PqqE/SkfB family radical SAM enzyme